MGDVADVKGDKIWAETLGPLLGNKDEIKGRKWSAVLLFIIMGLLMLRDYYLSNLNILSTSTILSQWNILLVME